MVSERNSTLLPRDSSVRRSSAIPPPASTRWAKAANGMRSRKTPEIYEKKRFNSKF
jgi:hypothetical protein